MAEKQAYGDIVTWMVDWWTQRQRQNVLILKYEDLVTMRREQINKIANFLGLNLTEQHLNTVYELSSFDKMKNNAATNLKGKPGVEQDVSEFIRKGKIGQWKSYFTVSQNEMFDQKYQPMLDKVGLTFQWS